MNKETKKFFSHANTLNKGFAREASQAYEAKVREDFYQVMPAPEVLHAYEDIVPGTMERLTSLMAQEQRHKHAMEEARLVVQRKAEFMGKVFAMLFVGAICYTTLDLAKQSLHHAALFSSSAFFSIFGISLFCKYRNFKSGHKQYNPNNIDLEKKPDEKGQDGNWKNNRSNYRKPTYKKKF